MTTDSASVYQLKITLQETRPPVWRRLQIPATVRLDQLHRAIQVAMGWKTTHVHEFLISGRRYGQPDLEEAPDLVPDRTVVLGGVAPGLNRRFRYVYDFGDRWEHEVLVEKLLPLEPKTHYPVCLAGEGCCPPEDCGGAPGYEEFLHAIRDPHHPPGAELLRWVGGRFDPSAFSLDAVNRALRRMEPDPMTSRRSGPPLEE